MAGYLGNPKLIMMTQDSIPIANFEYPTNPTTTINPVRIPVTWLNTSTGNTFICTDNTTDANVWKLKSGFRGVLLTLSADETIPHNTVTGVSWDTETYDTDGFHESVTNPSRITIPAGVSRVRLNATIGFDANATGERLIRFAKAGVSTFAGCGHMRLPAGTTSGYFGMNITSGILDVSSGDYFTCAVFQTSGGDLNVDYTFSSFSLEVIE